MRFQFLSIALLSAATSVLAKNSIVSIYLPHDEDEKQPDLRGKVVGINGKTTTYDLACGTVNTDCDFNSSTPVTLIDSPSDMTLKIGMESHTTATMECNKGNFTAPTATCVIPLVYATDGAALTTSQNLTYWPLTVTGTASGVHPNSGSATPKATGSSSQSPTSASAAATVSGSTSATATPTDNAAIMARAPLAVGGVAFGLAMAML
ncbi:hypothetical protein BDV25DRAFT_144900 [Aspergillus avenaceus]|uniref:GPI anchored protein n=1 Tax=Aspergillus avenaceus TaxID=36643 RepID=A0A5N6TFR7_ASPAV|nr:hypothetical protein BDV25DRAFT_144900 [Aspergillus avenaceus]